MSQGSPQIEQSGSAGPSHWTADRIETLKKLWDEGLTLTAIAETMGNLNKNQVVGKVHRLQLPTRKQATRKDGRIWLRGAKSRTVAEGGETVASLVPQSPEETRLASRATEAVDKDVRQEVEAFKGTLAHGSTEPGHVSAGDVSAVDVDVTSQGGTHVLDRRGSFAEDRINGARTGESASAMRIATDASPAHLRNVSDESSSVKDDSPEARVTEATVGSAETTMADSVGKQDIVATAEPVQVTEEPVAVAPQEGVAAAPQEEVAVAPQEGVAAAPQEPVAAAPQEEVAVAPQEEVAVAPQEEVAVAPQEEVAAAPQEPVAVAPEEPVAAAPQEPVAAAPQEEVAVAPQEPVAAAPQEEVAVAPEETATAAPQEEVAVAPEETATAAPQEEVTVAPQEPVAAAPQQEVTVAPEETVTVAPQQEVTVAPEGTVTVAPQEPVAAAPQEEVAAATEEATAIAKHLGAVEVIREARSPSPAKGAPFKPEPKAQDEVEVEGIAPGLGTRVEALFSLSPTGVSQAVASLRSGHCKWPIGDPKDPDFGFCLRPKGNAKGAYCEAHSQMAYIPPHARTRVRAA